MSSDSGIPPLEKLQNWFLTVVSNPAGIRDGILSAEAKSWIDADPATLDQILTSSHALGPADRLSIYGYAYFARLLDCLREEFPVLRKTLGDELFDGFVAGYIQQHPPRSYTLGELGSRFPDFLRSTRPAIENEDQPPDWADFLIDLAELERTFHEVFDGPGAEDLPPFDSQALAARTPQEWLELRLVPAPCLRLSRYHFAVHRFYSEIQNGLTPARPAAAETNLAITRHAYRVQHFELSREAWTLLSHIVAGDSLASAFSATLTLGESSPHLAGQIQNWFRDWSARGFFAKFE